MSGTAKTSRMCGRTLALGDWVRVCYKGGGQWIEGKIIELWSPELDAGHLQARVESGWCFHDWDVVEQYKQVGTA